MSILERILFAPLRICLSIKPASLNRMAIYRFIFHNSVQLSYLHLLQQQRIQLWRRTKRTTGHSDQGSNHHIPCIVHRLSSVHRQTWNWPHGYALASVRSSIGVLWQTVLESSASQHHWHLQTPLISWEHFPRLCLEILLTTRNILIINTNWNDKMTKETNQEQQNQEPPKWKHEKTKINTENNGNFPILTF